MSEEFDEILARARALPPEQRARLITALSSEPVNAMPAKPEPKGTAVEPPLDLGLYPNGLDADSGAPLLPFAPDRTWLHTLLCRPASLSALDKARADSDQQVLGPIYGADPDELAEVGWGVVVSSAEDAALLKALAPLIFHRCQEQGLPPPPFDMRAGESCAAWLARHVTDINRPLTGSDKKKIPIFLYYPGETASSWMARHGVSAKAVDPANGVPFYLLLAGRPGQSSPGDQAIIPFEFQYELDIFWGVGRVCFTDYAGEQRLSAYNVYAEQLVAYEQHSVQRPARRVVYFGTQHELDPATTASANELLRPLFEGRSGTLSAAARYGFEQELILGAAASRVALSTLFGPNVPLNPALIVSATHGVGFATDDTRLSLYQGAFVCQDWTGFGPVHREHWFAAEDIAGTMRADGQILLTIACYGLGCPQEDQFDWRGPSTRRIAPRAMVTQLPQELLLRGALAIFGHIDRAWTYSFRAARVRQSAGAIRTSVAQVQGFDDLLRRLMDGKRIGYATDQFNAQQGAIAVELSDLLAHALQQPLPNGLPYDIGLTWLVRNDLRNYAVLGDPAVRLRFPDLETNSRRL